jgi:CheY-like chemotaxis protein
MCRDETIAELGIDVCLTRPLRKSQLQKALLQLLGGSTGTARATPPPATAYPLHVLIAEDNPINQKVAVSMLQKLGCTTEVVGNGREALEQLQQHTYDLVLMDCQMPEMDGMEATAAIRTLHGTPARTPIAAMTAHAMASDRARCFAVGMDDYLTKPLSLEQLRRVLERFRPRDAEPSPPARRVAPPG